VPSSQHQRKRGPSCTHLCLPSKAATLILFWTAIVGVAYHTVLVTTVMLIDIKPLSSTVSISVNGTIPHAILAIAMMFYPLCGFVADVCIGRLTAVIISLCSILTFAIIVCFVEILVLATKLHTITYYDFSLILRSEGIFACILILASLMAFIVGLAGYQSSMIQLGFDQLLDAPTKYISLFIMYAVWAFNLGSIILITAVPFLLCSKPTSSIARGILLVHPFIIAIILGLLLMIGRWKRHWFDREALCRDNPYVTIYKVLNFARKHKHPIRRSAFTFCENYVPSRLDFAKERYGGPFDTKQVESVKTFARILIVLFSIGPLFNLEVPASYFVFPLFGLHTLHYHMHTGKELCAGDGAWQVTVGSGNLMNMLSELILYPLYIWLTYYVLQKRVRMFTRLFVGAIFCLLGVTSLLVIDVIGHSLKVVDVTNHTQCVFQLRKLTNTTILYPALNMHWSVLIPPSLLLGVGPLIVMATALEFIAAQSPQSMKGFLIGVLFAIRGFFQFLNSVVIIPFSLKRPWASGEMLENPPVTNCGFVYLLFTCVVGLIGLIFFSIAAKRYKYRVENEGWFRRYYIEEVYDRYISQATVDTSDYTDDTN
jgi:peptide/histidine transporter 3/4